MNNETMCETMKHLVWDYFRKGKNEEQTEKVVKVV